MTGFAGLLAGSAGRKVVDRTSLEGLYDFELNWTPDQIPANPPADAPFPRLDANGPSIFTALQEQLGLKLESHVDDLSVDASLPCPFQSADGRFVFLPGDPRWRTFNPRRIRDS